MKMPMTLTFAERRAIGGQVVRKFTTMRRSVVARILRIRLRRQSIR